MSSQPTSDSLDLERDLPTTSRDVEVLARLLHPVSWLAEGRALVDPHVIAASVRRRPTARAEWMPFTLPQD